jgi:hypothetical protein
LDIAVLVNAYVTFYAMKVLEEMKSSMTLLERKLEETSKQRDKAVQELGRLKQHLLDKVWNNSSLFVINYCFHIFF